MDFLLGPDERERQHKKCDMDEKGCSRGRRALGSSKTLCCSVPFSRQRNLRQLDTMLRSYRTCNLRLAASKYRNGE